MPSVLVQATRRNTGRYILTCDRLNKYRYWQRQLLTMFREPESKLGTVRHSAGPFGRRSLKDNHAISRDEQSISILDRHSSIAAAGSRLVFGAADDRQEQIKGTLH